MANKIYESPLPPSFGYVPWLIQLNGNKKSTQIFINPSDGSIEERTVPLFQEKICLGVFGEWILLMDPTTKELTLFNITLIYQKFSLPRLLEPLESLGGFVLTSPPTSTKCKVFFVSKGEKFVLHCKPKDENWKKVQIECDNFNGECFRGDISVCKGKLYALISPIDYVPEDYIWNQLAIIVIDVEALLAGVFENEVIGYPEYCANFDKKFVITSHLIVSADNVYLVSVYLFRESVVNIDMYKLKDPELYWNSVSEIGRRTFFLSSIYSTPFSENHIQESSIYLLLHEDGAKLYKISLYNGIASSILSIPEQADRKNQLYWMVPSRSRSTKWGNSSLSHSICSNETNATTIYKREENKSNISRSWADMPIELVDILSSRLNLVERIRLFSVCKAWSSLTLHSMHHEKARPLLMHYSKRSTTCRFYDPLYGYKYSGEINEFESCEKIWSSNNGWILMTRSNQSACILNPFTGVVVNLPHNDIFRSGDCNTATISSNRAVIAICNTAYDNTMITIYFWQHGMLSWIKDNIVSTHISCCNPIFLNEKLFCLDFEGNLQIFDRRDREQSQQTVVDQPESECEDSYLLEHQGKIFCVYQLGEAKQISIYRLDEIDSEVHVWTQIDNIGDITIFLDWRSSFAISSSQERYANRIYLPRFDGDESERQNSWAFYSMENRQYHPNINGIKEPINCIWIMPNLNE